MITIQFVKNYHEVVTKSCDGSRVKRFSSKSKEIAESIRAHFYVYLFPMLRLRSNSVRRDEFMANYKFRRKVKCKVRGFHHGFCRFYAGLLLLIMYSSIYCIIVMTNYE